MSSLTCHGNHFSSCILFYIYTVFWKISEQNYQIAALLSKIFSLYSMKSKNVAFFLYIAYLFLRYQYIIYLDGRPDDFHYTAH